METGKLTISIMVLFLCFVLPVSAHSGDIDNGYHTGMHGFFGMQFFGWILMIFAISVFILVMIWLIEKMLTPNKRRRK